MAYLVERDVDEYGCVDGDETLFPVGITEHDWTTPYPPVDRIIAFDWEPGEGSTKPDVFWYPQMDDWVCNERAYEVLTATAGGDIHTIARGTVDGDPVFLVQVKSILDVVDRERSIIERYPSYEILRFPAFKREAAEMVSSRVFRVPGSLTMRFVGEQVKAALEAAEIKGLRFVAVDWDDSISS